MLSGAGKLDVTAAVTFRSKVVPDPRFRGEIPENLLSGDFWTFSHFDPSIRGSMQQCIRWITDYVEIRYKGRVVTDFDQQNLHFIRPPIFPMSTLMDPLVSFGSISSSRRGCENRI